MNKAFIIYIVIAVYEILTAIYGICLTANKQEGKYGFYYQLRNVVRAAAFPLVLILSLISVLPFDLRCLFLDIILCVLAAKSISNLIQYKRNNNYKQPRIHKLILGCIGYQLLFFFAFVPAFLFPQHTEIKPTGDFEVAEVDASIASRTIQDYTGKGMRKINLTIWYPKTTSDSYPLLVFSHGAYGIRNSNYSAYKELASHGYIVCSLDHPGHSFYTKSVDGKVTIVDQEYFKEVQGSNTDDAYTGEEVYDFMQYWMKIRTDDMNLAFDTLLSGAANVQNLDASHYTEAGDIECKTSLDDIYTLIDTDKLGVFGHSMGAAASVQLGRMRSDLDAIINIDGPYMSEIKWDNTVDNFVAKTEKYPMPILNIYSDQIWVQLNDGTPYGAYAGNKISDQICPESDVVYLKGTKHLSLTDLALTSPFLTQFLDHGVANTDVRETLSLENKIILEYFDAKLKGIGTFESGGTYDLEK